MRVLWVGDAVTPTGFARCTHAVCDELHRVGHEVTVLGINHFGDPHDYPYDVYPCVNFTDGGRDAFGTTRLPRIAKRVQPDVIVFLNDPWNIWEYVYRLTGKDDWEEQREVLDKAGGPKLVGWLAVDADNQRGEPLNALDHVVTWTRYGLDQLRRGGYTGPGSVVPLGVNLGLFRAIPTGSARSQLPALAETVPEDAFIVGCVGRNQPRKRLDLTIEYFAEWLRSSGASNAYLLLHVAPTGEQGFDLARLADWHGVKSRVIATSPAVARGAEDDVMPYLYGSLDVLFTTTAGEGWCLPVLEAMACGTPAIVPDFAALGEWPTGVAIPMKCSSRQVNAPLNSRAYTLGAVPDKDQAVSALNYLYREYDRIAELSARGIELANEYPWSRTADEMVDVLENVVKEDREVRVAAT